MSFTRSSTGIVLILIMVFVLLLLQTHTARPQSESGKAAVQDDEWGLDLSDDGGDAQDEEFGIDLTPGSPDAVADDIYNNCTDKRYETPRDCLLDDTHRRLGCTGCFLSAECEGLKNISGYDVFKSMYNQALFFKGPVPVGDIAFLTLASSIINNFYAPYKSTDFNIIIEEGDLSFWAKLEQPEMEGQKPTFRVSKKLFLECSPAFLVQSIGHELVHMNQYENSPDVDLRGITTYINAFLELEASRWEIEDTYSGWKIGSNDLFECLRGGEQIEVINIKNCREWQTLAAIEKLNDWRPTDLDTLETWLEANPWTRDVWLVENPGWRKYNTNNIPMPYGCEPF
ncbi:MAG: hypothetical protein JW885_06955 [Deltaproteobacteria bacterium]|nr:hypothetical protein [Candidatus Zymogenaceae bacterium]